MASVGRVVYPMLNAVFPVQCSDGTSRRDPVPPLFASFYLPCNANGVQHKLILA